MNRFLTLIKMNVRLLLRNKAFIFFLIMTPIVSAIILGLKSEPVLFEEEGVGNKIIELEKNSDRAVYHGDTSAYIVKVYDASETELSEYVLRELAKYGMFSVCRLDVREMTEEEVLEQAKKDAFDDRAGVLLYLKKDFSQGVLTGDYENALLTYEVSEDERKELFENELSSMLSQIHQLAKAGMDEKAVLELLSTIEEELPEKEVVSLNGNQQIALDKVQSAYRDRIGYAFAIITLGFLFCGVCVAHTVIEEQENKVYTRMMLSGMGQQEYLGAKLVIAVVISVLQTFVLGICLFIAGNMDFGISKISFLFITFLLGVIFSVISLCIGVMSGDVMGSNYAVFAVWCVSAMLAGLYFPVDFSSKALKALSYLMPQKWFMRATELLFIGDKSAYSMVLCITVAYLIIVMSMGGIGLKIKRSDS